MQFGSKTIANETQELIILKVMTQDLDRITLDWTSRQVRTLVEETHMAWIQLIEKMTTIDR